MIGLMCIRDENSDLLITEEEIDEFARYFYQTYGINATVCFVNPKSVEEDFTTKTGIEVEASTNISYPSYVHLGVRDDEGEYIDGVIKKRSNSVYKST